MGAEVQRAPGCQQPSIRPCMQAYTKTFTEINHAVLIFLNHFYFEFMCYIN